MTPEQKAFIQGVPSNVEPAPKLVPEVAKQEPTPAEPREEGIPEQSTQAGSTVRSPSRRSRGRSRADRDFADDSHLLGMANLLVPLTTRLLLPTAAALKRAGLEQRLRGAEPATVQQIVEIAVAEWLQENDYL